MGNLCKGASSQKAANTEKKEKPVCPFKYPVEVDVEAGKTYYWCTCGKSKNQPWCDGSHSGTTFVPMEYKPTETKKAHMCQCKRTANPPLCDGTHTNPNLDWMT